MIEEDRARGVLGGRAQGYGSTGRVVLGETHLHQGEGVYFVCVCVLCCVCVCVCCVCAVCVCVCVCAVCVCMCVCVCCVCACVHACVCVCAKQTWNVSFDFLGCFLQQAQRTKTITFTTTSMTKRAAQTNSPTHRPRVEPAGGHTGHASPEDSTTQKAVQSIT